MPIVTDFFAEESLDKCVKKHIPRQGDIRSGDTQDTQEQWMRDFTLYKSSSRVEVRVTGKGWYKSYCQREGFSNLIKRGLKLVNHHLYKLAEEVSDEDLFWELYKFLPEAYEGLGIGYPKDIERELNRAVAKVREYWSPDVYRDIQERARAAGRKGKKYDVKSFLETKDMNASQAARHLGISRPTVYAMRREFSNVDPQTGDITDE